MGNIGIPPIEPYKPMPDDEKKAYDVTVVPKVDLADIPKVISEVAGTTAAASAPAVASIPAAAAPSVDAQTQREEAAMDREEKREERKDERQDRKDEATDARETRKQESDTASDVRAKDFKKTVLTIIAGSFVTIAMGAITTLGASWLSTRNITTKVDAVDSKMVAVDSKLAEAKETNEKTLHHVNSAHLSNLKIILRLTRRQHMLSGEEADRKDMEDAQKAVDEHEKADEEIRASKKSKG